MQPTLHTTRTKCISCQILASTCSLIIDKKMAKLGAYYGLCPLIDHRSLLGISKDEENGVVIVTLGKNIAIKFKVRFAQK